MIYFDAGAVLEWNLPQEALDAATLRLLERASDLEAQAQKIKNKSQADAYAMLHMQGNIWRAAACTVDPNVVRDYYKKA